MKKIIFFIIGLFIFNTWNPSQVLALTSSESATVTPAKAAQSDTNPIESQINSLKDKIASRVAQLKLVEKRGIIGVVNQSTDNQITMQDISDNTRLVDVDELTKFSSPSAKGSFGISDILKGTKIAVLGLYNKQSQRILARFVTVEVLPQFVHGVITDIDRENFTLTVATVDKNIIIDIETTTKISSYTKDTDITKSGFSKLKVGERVQIIGYPNKTQKDRVSALRIIIFPQIPNDPSIQTAHQLPTPTAQVSPSVKKSASSSAR